MTKDEALRLARMALVACIDYIPDNTVQGEKDADLAEKAITAVEAALEAKDEPVAAECKFDREKEWGRCSVEHHNLVQSEPNKWPGYQTRLLYTTPPQRTWVGLTKDELSKLLGTYIGRKLAQAIEAKLKEKNNG